MGKKLLTALTWEQVEPLLDVVSGTGALQKLNEPLQAVDPDLAQTVWALTGSSGVAAAGAAEARVSGRKALETWNGLWGTWESHVCEVGDEEGDYVIQERDWDPPYFDPSALADDQVNRTAYDKVLVRWQAAYRRRRNLWAEMRKLNLPGV